MRILLDTTIIVAIVTVVGMLLTELLRSYLERRKAQKEEDS